VIGTNGSGKSTLLNVIAGRFSRDRQRPHGERTDAGAEHRRAREIGRVFQNPFQGTCQV